MTSTELNILALVGKSLFVSNATIVDSSVLLIHSFELLANSKWDCQVPPSLTSIKECEIIGALKTFMHIQTIRSNINPFDDVPALYNFESRALQQQPKKPSPCQLRPKPVLM